MIRKIRDQFRYIVEYRRALALTTPLIDGRETRRVASALNYESAALEELPKAVDFDPRETFADRALEWARGR